MTGMETIATTERRRFIEIMNESDSTSRMLMRTTFMN